jgi:hypothetical protein
MLDLGAEGARLPGTDDLQAGIMIEVPSAALTAETLARAAGSEESNPHDQLGRRTAHRGYGC